MNKNIAFIPDKSLFDVLIDNNIDLLYLETVEDKFGEFIINEEFYLKLLDDVDEKINEYFIKESWKINFLKYYNKFTAIKYEVSEKNDVDLNALDKEIKNIILDIKKNIRKYNAGISLDDISLIAIAYFINKYTSFVPIIVSNDSDLLIHGHLLCSYFGMPNFFYSIYEFLRYINELDAIKKYINNLDIKLNCLFINAEHKKSKSLSDLNKLCLKNMLSLHPKLDDTHLEKNLRFKKTNALF